MEQSVYSNKKRIREKIAYFLRETFRPHTKEEYSELFSRGWKGADEGQNYGTPWLYLRVLAVLILLFTAAVLILFYSDNPLCYPTAIFFGGIMGNLPFIILLYEFYPKRDLSIMALFCIVIVGGLLSIGLVQIGYLIFNPNDGNRWAGVVWIGFLEELTKAVPAIVCILMFKKRDPYFAFLIGAAVATGFSLSEDTGYIFYYSKLGSGCDLSSVVYMGVERSLMAVCTHMPWTGIICLAFVKFRRPLVNFRFYLAFLLAMGLHTCWDLPIDGWAEVVDIAACTLIAVIFQIATIRSVRKVSAKTEPRILEEGGIRPKIFPYSSAAKLVGAISSVACSLLLLLAMYFNPHEAYVEKLFAVPEDLISYAQVGRTFEADFERNYDESAEDWEYTVQDGVKVRAIQIESYEDYTVSYIYSFSVPEDEDGITEGSESLPEESEPAQNPAETERIPVLASVWLEYEEKSYPAVSLAFGEDQTVRFFSMNPDIRYWYVAEQGIGVLTFTTYISGLWECITASAFAVAVLLGGGVGYTVLKNKDKRLNVERYVPSDHKED